VKINNLEIKAVDSIDDLKRFISQVMNQITTIFNNRITFADNFDGKSVSVSFTQSGVDTAVVHGLGRAAIGYFIINASAPMSLYNGSIASNDSILFLRSNNTGSATIMVF
jgi:hypothetical protein